MKLQLWCPGRFLHQCELQFCGRPGESAALTHSEGGIHFSRLGLLFRNGSITRLEEDRPAGCREPGQPAGSRPQVNSLCLLLLRLRLQEAATQLGEQPMSNHQFVLSVCFFFLATLRDTENVDRLDVCPSSAWSHIWRFIRSCVSSGPRPGLVVGIKGESVHDIYEL